MSPGRRFLVGRRGRGRGHRSGGGVGRVVVGSDTGRLWAVEKAVQEDAVGGERGRAGAQRGPVLQALPTDAPRGQRRHRLRLGETSLLQLTKDGWNSLTINHDRNKKSIFFFCQKSVPHKC